MTSPTSRRSRLQLAAATALISLLALSGCSSPGANADQDALPTNAAAGYPVTVETVYGEITLDEKPDRIVALADSFVDNLISLGEEPVAFMVSNRAGYDDPFEGFPWFDGQVDETALDTGLTEGYVPVLEAIAAYEPDLILGYGAAWSIDEEMYEQISLIAPTYTNPDTEESTAWQTQLRDIGALVGKTAEAEKAITGFDAELSDARTALSGLQGATLISADSSEPSTFTVFGGSFLLDEIGLEFDTEVVGEEGYRDISVENLDELTSDVILFQVFRADSLGLDAVGRAELEADPRFGSLPAVVNDAVIWAAAELTNASNGSTLGYSWYLDQVVPVLDASALNTAGD